MDREARGDCEDRCDHAPELSYKRSHSDAPSKKGGYYDHGKNACTNQIFREVQLSCPFSCGDVLHADSDKHETEVRCDGGDKGSTKDKRFRWQILGYDNLRSPGVEMDRTDDCVGSWGRAGF